MRKSSGWLLAALLIGATIPCQAADAPLAVTTNALAHEKSPYLLQHAHNPVQWHPWGEEAFALARKEKKPIFLSVGYSTCHWCHVMAHESFENPVIAKLMNEHFINVKVDREERPDVDRVYMTYVQATSGGGGWPMSVFLTPELKPFFGGTYFPPEDRFGRPGFPTVLQRLAEAWEKDHDKVLEAASAAVEALRQYTTTGPVKAGALEASALDAGFNALTPNFDDEQGGFGTAPKFPRPVALNFLFRYYARAGAESKDGKLAASMGLLTLRKMAAGGMHDHLGGGFHRYSVDRLWHVPHYEKMLYDQAQLACSYLDAFQITGDAQYAEAARDILDYVRRDLTDKAGGFYSAEDADSLVEHGKAEHREGAFYVWTKEEIDALLGGDAELFDRVYGVEAAGNSPEGSDPHGELTGKNTLIRRMTDAEAAAAAGKPEAEITAQLAAARARLFATREKRPRPHLDDKVITAWNGLMISAFARGAQVLEEPLYKEAAQRSARFIRQELWKDGTLLRSYREGAGTVKGFCDDYAFLISGLLDLYEADFNVAWLQWALELQARQDTLFADEHGGYFSVAEGDPNILLRMKEDYDGAEPSPNSVAALNLLRLAQITDQRAFKDRATKTLEAFSEQITKAPTAVPQMLCGLDAALARHRQIVIAGPDGAERQALLRETHLRYIPNKLLLLADGSVGQKWLGERLEFLRTVGPINGHAAAFVCEDFVCQLPVTAPEKLRTLLSK
jgi:uncharacterized protein YyaL (SSP411 family)